MPGNHVHKIFGQWIRSNRFRFQYPPKIIKKWKNGLDFQFVGAAPQLRGYINKRGDFGIWVYFQGWNWDSVMTFDVFPCRSRQGKYYCRDCKDAYDQGIPKETPLLYASRQELWTQHCFEPMLQWTNENLKPSRRLCLHGARGESTSASIKTQEEAETGGWGSIILPIIGQS